MAKEIKFNIKLAIDGKEQLVTATADVQKLKKGLDAAGGSALSFTKNVFTLNQSVEAFTNVRNAVSGLHQAMQALSGSYTTAEQANTMLATVMKQRISATDADIAKVKEVISAQTKLGVVGGSVQKMGAQQIATFLNQKGTLEKLIPAMNDLLVQQKGLNATQEDARGVANLMGKAMMGQTSALRRVGITFTEAEKQIMECGNEQERAAMLAQIITNNVGHMNAALAKTDAGQIKKAEMQFGALKVQLGEIVTKWLPQITFTAQALSIAASVISLTKSVAAAATVIKTMTVYTKASAVAFSVARISMVTTTATVRVLQAAFTGAAVGATTLKTAVRGLTAATGIGLLVTGVGYLAEKLITYNDKVKEAEQRSQDFSNQSKASADQIKAAYNSTLKSTYADLMGKYDALREKWSGLRSEQQKLDFIKNNRDAFNELRLKISGVADAESIFSKNTDAVVAAFEKRAKAAAYAAQLTELYQKQIALQTQKQKVVSQIGASNAGHNAKEGDIITDSTYWSERYGSSASGKWRFSKVGAERYNGSNTSGNKQIAAIDAQIAANNKQIAVTRNLAKDDEWVTPQPSTEAAEKTGKATANATKSALKGSLDWYTQEVRSLTAKMNATADDGVRASLHAEIEALEAEAKKKKIAAGIEKPEATKVTETSGGETYTDETDYLRKMYKNAQDAVSQAKSDLSAGIVSPKEFEEQVAAINDELAGLNLTPIEIEVEADDAADEFEDIQSAIDQLNNIDLTSFRSVETALNNIASLSESTAPGLSAAGAAASALGTSMQQLGADSEAAKAGMVMAALGQLALSFAQAMNSAAQNWVTWLAFGVAGTAQLVSMVATISKFATGGIVGGNKTSGDKVPVMVNSGEMILNRTQQARLFAIANGEYKAPTFAERDMPQLSMNMSALGDLSAPVVNINMSPKMRKMMGLMVEYGHVAEKSGKSYSLA